MPSDPELISVEAAQEAVWRVGFKPDPWAWSGWEYASNGRFPGRWDDSRGEFRTIYAGSSLLGCLVEVLAHFREDADLQHDLADIIEDPRMLKPSQACPRVWCPGRG